MIQKNDISVSFEIYNFTCSPADITAALKIIPTTSSTKGELKYIGPIEHPATVKAAQNMWSLDAQNKHTDGVEGQIEALLSILVSQKSDINNTIVVYNAQARFRCTLLFEDARPGIRLTNEQLKRIADLNADLDLDIYFLGDTE